MKLKKPHGHSLNDPPGSTDNHTDHLSREIEKEPDNTQGVDKKFRIRKKGFKADGRFVFGGQRFKAGFITLAAHAAKGILDGIRNTSFRASGYVSVGNYMANAMIAAFMMNVRES